MALDHHLNSYLESIVFSLPRAEINGMHARSKFVNMTTRRVNKQKRPAQTTAPFSCYCISLIACMLVLHIFLGDMTMSFFIKWGRIYQCLFIWWASSYIYLQYANVYLQYANDFYMYILINCEIKYSSNQYALYVEPASESDDWSCVACCKLLQL